MAGPKVSWFRREFDYWKYCARKRILTLLSIVFLILGLIGLTPFAPNFGYRDWISYACFIGAILLILIDDLIWKNKFKKMKVRRAIKTRDIEFVQEVQVYGGRPFIIFEEINKAIRSRYFKQKPVNIEGSYELHADARKKAIMFLEYFRLRYFHGTPGKQKKMWNDTKIRLHSSTSDLLGDAPVGLKITSYFDYLGTAFFSFRECLYDNDLFYDGKSLMKTYNGKLASIKDTKTAHHIGINALLITADKKILYQETKALAAPDHHAPSGSGSLDFKDIDLTSFEKTLLNGALREFSEETGWNDIAAYGEKAKLEKVEDMFSWPLGMSVDLSRGMVTDFFFVVLAEKDSHEEYNGYYRDGKVKLDEDELEPKNSIMWEQLDATSFENLKASINAFKMENLPSNAMLSLSLDFLLKALEEQQIVRDKILT